MPNAKVNPINRVPFGEEKTHKDFLTRAAWEYDEAAQLLATRPPGYSARVDAHERAAKKYTRLALDMSKHARQLARRELLITLLDRHRGNMSAVAMELGQKMHRLYDELPRLGIDPKVFRPPPRRDPKSRIVGRENMRALLWVMQQASEPLPPREIARRLEQDPATVQRWLAAAKRQGYVERVEGAKYQVRKEVPPL